MPKLGSTPLTSLVVSELRTFIRSVNSHSTPSNALSAPSSTRPVMNCSDPHPHPHPHPPTFALSWKANPDAGCWRRRRRYPYPYPTVSTQTLPIPIPYSTYADPTRACSKPVRCSCSCPVINNTVNYDDSFSHWYYSASVHTHPTLWSIFGISECHLSL